MVGEEEIASKTVKIKQLGLGEQNEGDLVERSKMIDAVHGLLKKLAQD
jgi:histidyl-tRNA synthetase